MSKVKRVKRKINGHAILINVCEYCFKKDAIHANRKYAKRNVLNCLVMFALKLKMKEHVSGIEVFYLLRLFRTK